MDIDVISVCVCVLTLIIFCFLIVCVCVCCYHLMVNKDVYIYVYTPFNAERPNSAWWHIWGEACFRSATPLHLHKCVARFVSDSWVSSFLVFNVLSLQLRRVCHWEMRCKAWLKMPYMCYHVKFDNSPIKGMRINESEPPKLGNADGVPPLGWPLKTSPLLMCVTTSNLAVLQQRVYA